MGKLINNESISKDLLKGTNYEKEQKIAELKKKLSDTDYKAIKYAECEMTAEEYAETKSQRSEWRAEINAIETNN